MTAASSSAVSLSPTIAKKDEGKPYLTAFIDRAIVMTQHDLRGFCHPLGFRHTTPNQKSFDATIGNFMAFAANAGHNNTKTDPEFVGYFDSSFEEYLAMCKRLAACCDGSEKEGIQLIVREFVRQHKWMAAQIAVGKMEKSP